jgi:hypothetical protein
VNNHLKLDVTDTKKPALRAQIFSSNPACFSIPLAVFLETTVTGTEKVLFVMGLYQIEKIFISYVGLTKCSFAGDSLEYSISVILFLLTFGHQRLI